MVAGGVCMTGQRKQSHERFSAEVEKWEGATGKRGQALCLTHFSNSCAAQPLR